MKNNLSMYRGYFAEVWLDVESKMICGCVDGLSKKLTFKSENACEIEQAFHNTIDCYLENCKQRNQKPERQYRGPFSVRMDDELHRKLAFWAQRNGVSLNGAVIMAVKEFLLQQQGKDMIAEKD